MSLLEKTGRSLTLPTLLLFVVLQGSGPSATLAKPLWKIFTPVDQVETRIDGDYALSEEHGPWLVMAATFSGEGADEQANELVSELRQHYNIPAYLHSMTFDYSSGGDRVGRGLDRYGAPLRMRYQGGNRNQEVAVLVGNFLTIDDPQAQKLLEQIKTLRPKALGNDVRETSQNLAQEREYLTRLQGSQGAPPMRKAFLARNPALPKEYFQPKGVDKFIAKMNRGVEFSLLDCPGKYSVRIASFRGKGILQGAFKSGGGSSRPKKKPKVDPLVEAAENAHNITQFLRAKGWDAYEFHDRTESYVTVGSYDQVVRKLPTGQSVPIREVSIVIRTFGAAFETPDALSVGSPVPRQDRVRAQQVKQQFNNLLSNQHGQIAHGLKPKYIEYVRNEFIPLDVHPHVIEAPKRSVSSAYAWHR